MNVIYTLHTNTYVSYTRITWSVDTVMLSVTHVKPVNSILIQCTLVQLHAQESKKYNLYIIILISIHIF